MQVPRDHFKSTVESFNHVNIKIRANQFEITISSIEVDYVVGLLRPQMKFSKVMFLHVCVCPQGERAWQGGMHDGGVHGRGHAWWWGHVW